MAKATLAIPGMRISGKLWGAVMVERKDGSLVLRELPRRKPRRTGAQGEAPARLRRVGEAWRALSAEENARWRLFAGAGGREAYLAFTALASKCLQMRPDAPVPCLPPARPFSGDGIEVTVGVSSSGRGSRQGEASLVFFANGPNAPGVVTELLAQRLANANRAPEGKAYRGRRFVAFARGALEATVSLAPGAWACAVRFVREDTGQEAGLVELGVVEAG